MRVCLHTNQWRLVQMCDIGNSKIGKNQFYRFLLQATCRSLRSFFNFDYNISIEKKGYLIRKCWQIDRQKVRQTVTCTNTSALLNIKKVVLFWDFQLQTHFLSFYSVCCSLFMKQIWLTRGIRNKSVWKLKHNTLILVENICFWQVAPVLLKHYF